MVVVVLKMGCWQNLYWSELKKQGRGTGDRIDLQGLYLNKRQSSKTNSTLNCGQEFFLMGEVPAYLCAGRNDPMRENLSMERWATTRVRSLTR